VASYHLWNPAYIAAEPLTLECFATLGDTFFLSRGTDDLVRAALAAIGVDVDPTSWQFEAMRTHYFGSYRGTTGDWRDDWALAWRLRATLRVDRAPTIADCPIWGYYDLDAVDTTFDPQNRPDQWDGWPGLILADSHDANVIAAVCEIVEGQYHEAACVLGERRGCPQLRCDLGFRARAFYESGAPEFESTLAQIIEAGASVRFDDGI
jgi:hypothetical protein